MAPHSPPSVEHASTGAEPTQLLRNAMLKSLSGAQRLIILLRYAEQMTDAEIAGAVDMTAEQVERHHDEAIRILRDSVGLQAA